MKIIFYSKEGISLKFESSNSDGFWAKLSDNGLEVYDVSAENHMKFISENPELFHLSTEKIKNTYEEFNEPLGLEGKARESLIKYAASIGWIRIRHYVGKKDYWSIQCDATSKRKKELHAFARWAINKGAMTYRDDLVIIGYNNIEDIKKYDFMNGGAARFLQERKKSGK